MIVKFNKPGKSFKGLGHYLTHDVKAATSDRVGWTHTLNCANDHVPSAVHEMYGTYRDAELLKEEAGIKRGGQPLQSPVKHFSLSWHPEESPTKEQIIGATEGFLHHMGWQDHQAVLASHTDKEHAHVHVMLNVVHPETGRKLGDGYEQRRAQEWALEYERENGRVYCAQRELPVEEREPSPTRPTHMAMKEADQALQAQEKARQEADEKRAEAEKGPKTAGEEWTELKTEQREARMAFFADGRDAFRDISRAAYRQTRAEFRELWSDFYALQRDGLDIHGLIDLRDDLVKRQHEALIQRRDQYCAELRETRDLEYAGLLASQKAERALLTARLADYGSREGSDYQAHNQNVEPTEPQREMVDGFRAAAGEVTREAVAPEENIRGVHDDAVPFDDQDWTRRSVGPRVRDGEDIAANLTGGVIGGLGTIAESLFDGFFGQPMTPQAKEPAPRRAELDAERPRRNVFAEAAEQAKRTAEQEAEERKADEWWDERRARTRD